MRRFWITFPAIPWYDLPVGAKPGCGVTAPDRDTALRLIREALFSGEALPQLEVVEDIDVSTLDATHVLPNMGDPTRPGVWFPRG